MNSKHILILAFSFLILLNANAQSSDFKQGFDIEVSGKPFSYHSPFPDVTQSLIVRGRSDYQPIEWKTEPVHLDGTESFVNFIFLYAMDVSSSPSNFAIYIDDTELFQFSSPTTSTLGERLFKDEKGSVLLLNATMNDKYNDHMGFATLKMPVGMLKNGKATKLKVSPVSTDNEAWFMLYKTTVREKISIYQNNVVAKKEGELFHSISIDFIHVGKKANAKVSIGELEGEIELTTGFNKMELYLTKVDAEQEFTADIQIEGKAHQKKIFQLKPVKEWEIYLVQHTHTDIGYTRPQTEILPEHLRYIDNALDFCDQTDHYPDEAKFRWTCETSWSVREYLKSRPKKQVERLVQRIKEGRIEATGMFLNYSEIIDESALATQIKYIKALKDQGIEVTTLMQNDVNGIGWSVIDYTKDTDLKYLTMGVHAHRARKPFNKPTSFWWESPAGNRLMAYRSEHYQHANILGITTGQQDVLRNNMSKYLRSLEDKNYPYHKISLQFSGYITDNSPPSIKACDIIKDWNEKYEWPKLRSALAKDFMMFIEEEHAEDLPVKKVAWPDWWTDGTASAANETKTVRQAQSDLSIVEALFCMSKLQGTALPKEIHDELHDAYYQVLFYDEHTHGSAESVSEPFAQNTINQWGMKSSYAWEAAKQTSALEEKAMAFLESQLEPTNKPSIVVYNTLSKTRSGVAKVFLQNELVPEGADFTITDKEGKEIPYQRKDQRVEGVYLSFWLNDIPAFGYKTLQINLDTKAKPIPETGLSKFENQYYQLVLDLDKGMVSSIIDKDLNIELLDLNDTLSLGQIVYEQLDNRHEMERLTSSNRDTVFKPLSGKQSLMQDIRLLKTENAAIYQSLFLNGKIPDCADEQGVNIEIRLYHHTKKIEFLYRMVKLPVYTPEAVYVAFPFKLNDGKLAFEAQGGVVYPGVNQLEGTSSDWNTIQNFASVRNSESQIVFVSDEIPLVQFGAINTGRYYYRLKPKTNHIYSWVLNNYWVTNFKASQGGELQWKYAITSSKNNSDAFATQFGWSERFPLKARVILPDSKAKTSVIETKSFIRLDVPNLHLVKSSLSMDNKGIILHLRELNGTSCQLDIKSILKQTKGISATEVNIFEEEQQKLKTEFTIKSYETKFIKIDLEI